MSDALKLAVTITAVDMFSGVLRHMRGRIQGAGAEAQRVRRDFDQMERSIGRGVKALAGAAYIAAKLKPGVAAAADLQEEMLGVKAEMGGAHVAAATLAKQMKEIKQTAFSVQAWTPFDMTQIVAMEKELVKAGARVSDIVGKNGAAAATAALATYSKMDPTVAGNDLIGIGTPFKVKASGYSNLADLISRAASASTVDASDIAESAKYSAGEIASLGGTPRQMMALVAMMGQSGVTGSMAGTNLKNFFSRLSQHKAFQDSKGDLKSIPDIIKILHEKTDKMGKAQRSAFLTKAFGQDAVQTAIAILGKGDASFASILKEMDNANSLTKKMNMSMQGLNKQVTSLGGTSKSVFAEMFQPALAPLTELVKKTNDWVAALGKAEDKHPAIGKTLTYGGGAIAGALAAGGLYGLFKGGRAGLRVLRGIKGLGGGVAAGKAMEAAAGVTPVYVVNMPSGGFGGGSIPTEERDAKSAAGWFRRLRKMGPTVGELSGGGLMGAAKLAGGVAAAGTAGYAVGTMINKGLLQDKNGKDTSIGRDIGEGVAHVMAWFGDHSAQEAIHTHMHQQKPSEVHVRVEVEGKDGAKARVKSISSRNARAQLDTAPAMMGGG